MKLTKRELFAIQALTAIIAKTETVQSLVGMDDEDYLEQVEARVLGAIDYADTLVKYLKVKK